MPIEVELDDQILEFPDEMTQDEIKSVLKDKFPSPSLSPVGRSLTEGEFSEISKSLAQESERQQMGRALYGPGLFAPGGPEMDFARALYQQFPSDIGKGLHTVMKPVEEVAAPLAGYAPIGTAARLARLAGGEPLQQAMTEQVFQPGESVIPGLQPPAEAVGIIPSLRRAGAGMTTPGGLALLPVAGAPGIPGRIAATAFGTGAAAAIPAALQQFAEAKTPAEKRGAITDATLSAAFALLMGRQAVGKEVEAIQKIKVEDRGEVLQQMFNEYEARRQAEAGSPFTLAEPPTSPVSMGVRTQPALSGAPTFEPSGLGRPLEAPAELRAAEPGTLQPPPPTIAPGTPSGRAAQRVRLQGEAAQRAADFERAMSEKVAQEQTQPAHPDKPLTANQLRIIQESLRNEILSGQIGRERSGIISGGALEAWADQVFQNAKDQNLRFSGGDTKMLAAGVVKAAALLERGVVDAARWTAEMVKEFGESIRPFLNDIRSQAEQLRLSVQKGGDKDAVQQKAEGAVRDVRQPEIPQEGAGQVPAAARGQKAAEARVEHTLESDKALYKDISDRMLKLVREGKAATPLMEVLKAELEVVKNRHEGMPPGQTSPARKTMQAQQEAMKAAAINELAPAVRIGGKVVSDPNKGHIQMALEIGGPDALADVSNPANQGFVYKGEFLSREAAASLIGEKNPLTTERLRELREGKQEPAPEVESVTALEPATGSPIRPKRTDIWQVYQEPSGEWVATDLKTVYRHADKAMADKVAKVKNKDAWLTKLEALKFKPKGGTGELHALRPDILQRVGRQLWNDAIDLAIFTIRSGKTIAEAIDAALAHIRTKRTGIDEAPMREELQRILGPETPETPTTRPAPAATPPPVPAAAPVDPITGEPAKVVTAKEAKAMESKVKIPAETDVKKLTEQIDLFNKEIGDALESGGQFLPKELRPDVAKGAPAEKGTVTNKAINQYFVNKLSSIRKDMIAAGNRIKQQADIESQVYFDLLQKRFEQAFRQVQELRRASHESLYFWNKIKAEYQAIAQAAGAMPEMKRWLPVFDSMVRDLRLGKREQAARTFVDFLRLNQFTAGSWTLDFGTNLAVAATRLPAWAIMDMGSLITGRPPARMATAIRALGDNMRNWNPLGKRFRLPEKLEMELGNTIAGEFGGRGREIFFDFSEILKGRPEMADKLRHLDKLATAPVRMKRAVDGFFGRFGATAELYHRAYIEGKSRGLKGDDLKTFTEEYVSNPPEVALDRAIKAGKEFKFNRDLMRFEEGFANNLAVKLFVETYPRWTLQFIRWAGEMTGLDPVFAKKLLTGKATGEEAIKYLTKAATGWGGIYAFNQLFYDSVDSNSMEYVKEDGNRVRLSGRTPVPEIYFVCALLRGDTANAKAALPHMSLPLAKALGGEPGGLLSPLIDVFSESLRGRYTAEQSTRELNNIVNNMIPGKTMLGLIRAFFDPTLREGIGSPIPGVSSLLPQPVDPTTGEPRAPKQRIPGTKIEIPTVAGTPFPGAERVLNDVESALLDHALGNIRPRRTSIIDLPAEDVPKAVRKEYEQMVGRNVKELIGEEIKSPDFWKEGMEIRREILQQLLTEARAMARDDIADKYGASGESVKSPPLSIQRLPKRMQPSPSGTP